MNNLLTLPIEDKSIRTQITLSASLKKAVEDKAQSLNQSLSEYLRRAALLSLLMEEGKRDELKNLANRVIGSLNLTKHPEWQTRAKTNRWLKNIRSEWK